MNPSQTMQAVRETLATTDDGATNALEKAWEAGKLSWVKTPYWRKDAEGKSRFGRGLVQITRKANYQKLGLLIGVDLVKDPVEGAGASDCRSSPHQRHGAWQLHRKAARRLHQRKTRRL
jgi:predicted chitinase